MASDMMLLLSSNSTIGVNNELLFGGQNSEEGDKAKNTLKYT